MKDFGAIKGRVSILIVLAAGLAIATVLAAGLWRLDASKAREPWTPLRSANPEAYGFSSAKLAEGLDAVRAKGTRIHQLMLLRRGAILSDAYFEPYDGTIYHKAASVTKSFIATLIGIAWDEGLLDLDARMLDFFPDRAIEDAAGAKGRITVRHLLSMNSGLAGGPDDDEAQLRLARSSPDWVQYALDRPMVREPGSGFRYSSLDMHILSAIIRAASGRSAEAYAKEKLFGPLGIEDYFWAVDPQGNNRGWGDLCLFGEDMAKFGTLYLAGGVWEGRRLVSARWIREATRARTAAPGWAEDYGYGFWVSRERGLFAYYMASGSGGQSIRMLQALDVVVVTSGGGFDMGQVGPYLEAAFLDYKHALQPDAAGLARLRAAELPKTDGAEEPAIRLPVRALAISGKRFLMEKNPQGLRAISMDFGVAGEVGFVSQSETEGERKLRIGLGSRFLPNNSGMPVWARGAWRGEDRFEFTWSEGPGMEVLQIRLDFSEDSVLVLSSSGGVPLGEVSAHLES